MRDGLVSGGAGSSGGWWHPCGGCADEGGGWVTLLCERMNVMGGVSDVDNHEQVQPDRRIKCFSEDV